MAKTRGPHSRFDAAPAMLVAALLATAQEARASACYTAEQYTIWFANSPICHNNAWPTWNWCWLVQSVSCADGTASPVRCYQVGDGGCIVYGQDQQAEPVVISCPNGMGGPEVCDGNDNNFDGCKDEGCTIGKGQCTCVASCAAPSCDSPVPAACDPFKKDVKETCNGADDNCNTKVDESCLPENPLGSGGGWGGGGGGPGGGGGGGKCNLGGSAGSDPILLYTRSAVTEPFADFEVETLGRLGITRTYSSADGSLQGGPPGVFGRGWHHDWEAALTCSGDHCTITRGLRSGLTFRWSGPAASLDGTETWDVYGRGDTQNLQGDDGHGVLVRRPSGTWIFFAPDGAELHFATACDACGVPDATCIDPLQGGKARLIDLYDRRGTRTHVTYARAAGLLIGLSDDLGHALEVRAPDACTEPIARELRFDGAVVATYEYEGQDLVRATDADGNVLRRYFYYPGGYLHAVVNEGGAAIAEFAYDASGDAVSVIDAASESWVTYAVTSSGNLLATVTERYGLGAAVSVRELDHSGQLTRVSGECSCGPRPSMKWSGGRLECIDDGAGSYTYRQHDTHGRLVYTATYPRAHVGACPPGIQPSGDSRQEWYGYGLVKPIADGITLPLDIRTSTLRGTGYSGEYVGETLDYDQAPNPVDPPGYECAPIALPVGAAPCRRIESGFTYAANGARILQRYATFYSYDARARLARTVGPVSLDGPAADDVTPVEERTYWPDGETMARRGRLREVRRYPGGVAPALVTTTDYDSFGPYSITEPSGTVTLLVKDGRGRVRWTMRPGQTFETRFYDGSSPRLTIAPSGATVRTGYDARGRLNLVEYLDRDPDQPGATPVVAWSEHTTYDPAGNPVHVERRDGTGAVTWARDRAHDVQHRVTSEEHPDRPGVARSWSYDPGGFLSDVADEEQRTTTFEPDPWRRVASVTRAGTGPGGAPASTRVAAYTYEPWRGTMKIVQDGKGNGATYVHDDFGRIARLTTGHFKDPWGYWFSYDARGNLRERRSTYQTIRYAYDGVDRLTSVLAQECGGFDATCTPANTSVPRVAYEYRYDEGGRAGKLTSILDGERTVRFDYDAAGRLREETMEDPAAAGTLVTGYAYDGDGRTSEITYPSGLRVKLDRDVATGGVRKVSTADGTLTFADGVTRWPGGPLRTLTFGSGEVFSATFNKRYEPVTLRSGPLALDYTMTPAGNVERIVEPAVTREFGYDHLERLVFAAPGTGDGVDLEHRYASNPSWPSVTLDRIKQSGTPGPTGFQVKHSYDYDRHTNVSSIGAWANGRVVAAACLRHDPLGRMVLVGSGPNNGGDWSTCLSDAEVTAPWARFRYDASHRRVARWSAASGEWTHFVHGPGGELLAEMRSTGDPGRPWEPVREYVWLDGRPLAQVEHAGGTARTYYVHADHLGTPRRLTSAEGTTVWTGTYQPYGEVSEVTAPDPVTGRTIVTNLRLPGQYDERLFGSVGLQGPYYNWNRWYLPGVGRYLELDPIALAGWFNGNFGPDWYNYAEGNPLSRQDATGRNAGAIIAGGLAAGTAVGLVLLFKHCMEKCTGTKIGTSPKCDDPAAAGKLYSKCSNFCANWAVLLGCIGVGEAALCSITAIEQKIGGVQ